MGKRQGVVFLFAVALVLGAAGAQAKGRKPPAIFFTVEPATVTAGRTLTVWCDTEAPLKNAAVYFNERKGRFYPAEGRLRALLGIHSLETPGVKELSFYAEGPGGKVRRSTAAFEVEAGSYPVSRVKITAEKDKLIASGRLERDAAALDKVYREPRSEEKLWSGLFVLPTTGTVSSVFGARRAYGQRETRNAHTGLDIANEPGTPVAAPARGRVVFADWLDSFGHVVVLDHGQSVFSYYLHMRKRAAEQDTLLNPGDPIGEMGAEGLVTGPHLHWSFVVAGERVDPVEWTEREFK